MQQFVSLEHFLRRLSKILKLYTNQCTYTILLMAKNVVFLYQSDDFPLIFSDFFFKFRSTVVKIHAVEIMIMPFIFSLFLSNSRLYYEGHLTISSAFFVTHINMANTCSLALALCQSSQVKDFHTQLN